MDRILMKNYYFTNSSIKCNFFEQAVYRRIKVKQFFRSSLILY